MKRISAVFFTAIIMLAASACTGTGNSVSRTQVSSTEQTTTSEVTTVTTTITTTEATTEETTAATSEEIAEETAEEITEETTPEIIPGVQIIPEVYITVNDNSPIYRYDYVGGTFSLSVPADNPFYAGEDIAIRTAQIKGRGNSTWKWPKKPYAIKLSEACDVLGMGKNKDWVLLANYTDKTLMRNEIGLRLGQELDGIPYTPESVYVDLYVNGVYRGLYNLCEKIEKSEDRLDIEESMETDTDYIIEVGGDGSQRYWTGTINNLEIKHPSEATKEQLNYIIDYLKTTEKLVQSCGNYDDYIDMDSLVDWFILMELSFNTDSCFYRSCYMVKEKGGKLVFGPPWDFDLAFGNYMIDNKKYDNWVTIVDPNDPHIIHRNLESWGKYLFTDPKFTEKFRERWEEVGDRLLRIALDKLSFDYKYTEYSRLKNFDKWQILGVKVAYEHYDTVYMDYDDNYYYLRKFLVRRKQWIDNAVKLLP